MKDQWGSFWKYLDFGDGYKYMYMASFLRINQISIKMKQIKRLEDQRWGGTNDEKV